MSRFPLSKSRFQSGRQCQKRLWLETHRRDLLQWSASARSRLEEGTRFGELARSLLGGGVLIEAEHFEIDSALAQTSACLAQSPTRVPMLFEAAFEHAGVRIRVDALLRLPLADRLIEIKASTSVKDEYLWDCAIQTWVLRGAGRPVQTVTLGLVDNRFVYRQEGNYEGLLLLVDVTSEVEALLPEISGMVETFQAVAEGPQPQIATGPHCLQPYECPFLKHCRDSEPPGPKYPVEDLPRAPALIRQLRQDGYVDLRDVPDDRLAKPLHQRVLAAARSGKAVVAPQLAEVLGAIPYPRYYLDFETISFTTPRWLGTTPFQPLPFQFSCHVEHADGHLEHHEFLDLSGSDPTQAFIRSLLAATEGSGPILVWNQGFEIGRVRELARMSPDDAEPLHRLIDRIVDLLPIYRDHYYHRDMHGSWSIKAVLPTIAPEMDYQYLAITDGGQAQDAYLDATAPGAVETEREAIRRKLLDYCCRDTEAMVRLSRCQAEGKPHGRSKFPHI